MIREIIQATGLVSIIDWLVVIAVLLAGVIAALIWLGVSVESQFRHHDRDLRAEVEHTNKLIMTLIGIHAGDRIDAINRYKSS